MIIRIGVLFFSIMFSVTSFSQGVQFVSKTNWDEVLKRAKRERKYVFVDCFATWCKPCKEMEQKVFPVVEVSELLNAQFISVRMQMDSTFSGKGDGVFSYKESQKMASKYGIKAYPTFLFFSPSGSIVHKGIGTKGVESFKELIVDAMDDKKQYYSLLSRLKKGQPLADSTKRYLSNVALKLKDSSASRLVSRAFIDAYEFSKADTLPDKEMLRLSSPYISSKDRRTFRLFYPESQRVDSLYGSEDISKWVLKNVILVEEIKQKIVLNNDFSMPKVVYPDWEIIRANIEKKYGTTYAGERILFAKREWYKKARLDWDKLAEVSIEYIDKYMKGSGTIELVGINNIIWNDIFMNVSDTALLTRAAEVMLRVIKADNMRHFGYIDTYANLLYKAGNVEEAKRWQEKAVRMSGNNKDANAVYDKMKAGLPTWPVK